MRLNLDLDHQTYFVTGARRRPRRARVRPVALAAGATRRPARRRRVPRRRAARPLGTVTDGVVFAQFSPEGWADPLVVHLRSRARRRRHDGDRAAHRPDARRRRLHHARPDPDRDRDRDAAPATTTAGADRPHASGCDGPLDALSSRCEPLPRDGAGGLHAARGAGGRRGARARARELLGLHVRNIDLIDRDQRVTEATLLARAFMTEVEAGPFPGPRRRGRRLRGRLSRPLSRSALGARGVPTPVPDVREVRVRVFRGDDESGDDVTLTYYVRRR